MSELKHTPADKNFYATFGVSEQQCMLLHSLLAGLCRCTSTLRHKPCCTGGPMLVSTCFVHTCAQSYAATGTSASSDLYIQAMLYWRAARLAPAVKNLCTMSMSRLTRQVVMAQCWHIPGRLEPVQLFSLTSAVVAAVPCHPSITLLCIVFRAVGTLAAFQMTTGTWEWLSAP
jgi:hypothetical protein